MRPGGYFPYADLRPKLIAALGGRPAATPLRQLSQRQINAEVPASETITKSRDLVTAICRPFLRFAGREFIGAGHAAVLLPEEQLSYRCTASPGRLEPVSQCRLRMSPAEREFRHVLYGATGFSGKLTAEHPLTAGQQHGSHCRSVKLNGCGACG